MNRYVCDNEIGTPTTVYMSPNVQEYLSIAGWKFAKGVDMILQPIPQCVFSKLTEDQLTIFDKVRPAFQRMIDQK